MYTKLYSQKNSNPWFSKNFKARVGSQNQTRGLSNWYSIIFNLGLYF